MRIVVDVTSLLVRSAGVKTYMYYWVNALLRQSSEESIACFPFFPNDALQLDHENSVMGRRRTMLGKSLVHLANVRGNPILELLACRADIFHASQHLRNPPHFTTRLTATIYDMTCWLMPQMHRPANVAATRLYADRVLRRARGCIAISEQTRKDAVDILGLPQDRVEVIYPGVADEFFQVDPPTAAAAAKKYGLQKPYILFVGTIEPRKNVDRVLDAYQALCPPVRSAFDLVIAGSMGWCSDQTAQRIRNPQPGIRYLGYVAESDLPRLTAAAAMFVFPSLYEGFGIPVAQAMAAGVPVITSLGSSLEEIAGEDALLVDPHCVEEITAAMERLASAPSLRKDLGERGRQRAAQFRWRQTAALSLAFFRRIAAG
jgi:alpha-1,3-rhamnosyl/mannosyltransferase